MLRFEVEIQRVYFRFLNWKRRRFKSACTETHTHTQNACMAMCTCALHLSMYCMYTCCSRSHEHEHNHSHTDAILKRALLFSLLVLRYTIFWTNVFLIWLVFKPANKCTHSHARALSVYVQLESVQSSKCENLYVEFKCTRVHTTYMHASAGLYCTG